MKIEELSDNPTPGEIMRLDKPDLDVLPYDVLKWTCCVDGCDRGTTVRDYGLTPYYFLNRNSKAAERKPETYWINAYRKVWFCGKHLEYLKRLGAEYVFKKWSISPGFPVEIVKKVNQQNEIIN